MAGTLTSVETQLRVFYDTDGTGAFFSTPLYAPHIILRLKDGMDSSEPSTNGISASNPYRLSSLLNDESYSKKAKETVAGFESEMLQYPWLFASFMPSIVAGHLGVKGIVVSGYGQEKIKEYEKQPRRGLTTFAKLEGESKWLRERNTLLADWGRDGTTRVMVCENGSCQEERVIDLSEVKDALPE